MDIRQDPRGLSSGKWVAGGFPTSFYTGKLKLDKLNPELHNFSAPSPVLDTSNLVEPLGGLERVDLFASVTRDVDRVNEPNQRTEPTVSRKLATLGPDSAEDVFRGQQAASKASLEENSNSGASVASRPAGPDLELARRLFIV